MTKPTGPKTPQSSAAALERDRKRIVELREQIGALFRSKPDSARKAAKVLTEWASAETGSKIGAPANSRGGATPATVHPTVVKKKSAA